MTIRETLPAAAARLLVPLGVILLVSAVLLCPGCGERQPTLAVGANDEISFFTNTPREKAVDQEENQTGNTDQPQPQVLGPHPNPQNELHHY